jgi:hypothetical protein
MSGKLAFQLTSFVEVLLMFLTYTCDKLVILILHVPCSVPRVTKLCFIVEFSRGKLTCISRRSEMQIL